MNKFIILTGAFLFASCASITQGTNQLLAFSISPVEATCTVTSDDGGQVGSVSGSINMLQVSKDNSDLLVNCVAEGYKPKITRLTSSTQTAGVIGIVIDLGIVDMLTGAMWKYPDHTTIIMEKE